MSIRLKATYTGGAFIPLPGEALTNLPEDAEVELTVHTSFTLPPAEAEPEKRAQVLRRMVERMKANPLPAGAPRFMREELHERR